jgi:Fe-S cluster biogenesis protein NfuA
MQQPQASLQTADGEDAQPGSLYERVEAVLNLIRPAVQSDGGDLELVEVTPAGTVRVRFHGACVGCPSSTMTLQTGIERTLKQRVPEVSSVEPVN